MRESQAIREAIDRGMVEVHAQHVAKDWLCEDAPLHGIGHDDFQKLIVELGQAYKWKVAHFRRVHVHRANGSHYHETPVAADGKGFPDLLLVRGNRLVALEIKTGKGRLEPEQKSWLEALSMAGCTSVCVRPEDWPWIVDCLR